MSKSLLELLPQIVAEGKREAERVLERAESNYRFGLQTRELVIPSRDSNWRDLLRQADKAERDNRSSALTRTEDSQEALAMPVYRHGSNCLAPSLDRRPGRAP